MYNLALGSNIPKPPSIPERVVEMICLVLLVNGPFKIRAAGISPASQPENIDLQWTQKTRIKNQSSSPRKLQQ